jgi:serine/threonine protein kinase
MIGKELGRYLIVESLGEGGMAAVYKGYDRRLDRDVAIKVILPGHVHDEMFTKRFEREARAVAQLTHTHIVGVHDYGTDQGISYLVMAYIPGGTMKDLLGKPIPWQKAARKLAPIARALEYAHQKGIIHRDIKPANILVTQSGDLMLTDFGIAKAVDSEEMTKLTKTGTGIGTPAYMAPEQGMGDEIDHRADIYSLGIVFYEMITGRPPFRADTPIAVMMKHVNFPLPRPTEFVPDIPDKVEKVLYNALAKNPELRFKDMGEFAQALEDLTLEPQKKTPIIQLADETVTADSQLTYRVPPPEEKQEAAPVSTPIPVPETVPSPVPAPTQRPAALKKERQNSTQPTILKRALNLPKAMYWGIAGVAVIGILLVSIFIFAMSQINDQAKTPLIPQNQWVVVLSQDKVGIQQNFRTKNSLTEIAEVIETEWKNGLDITNLVYGDGQWTVVFSRSRVILQQIYRTKNNLTEIAEIINEEWKNGFDITGLTYGDRQWVVIFSKGKVDLQQRYRTKNSLDDIASVINEEWGNGFDITDMEFGDGQWVVVFSKGSVDLQQRYRTKSTLAEIADVINQEWKNGFDLSDLVYGDGQWVAVFSKGKENLQQSYRTKSTISEIAEVIKDEWKNGFDVTDIIFGKSK